MILQCFGPVEQERAVKWDYVEEEGGQEDDDSWEEEEEEEGKWGGGARS